MAVDIRGNLGSSFFRKIYGSDIAPTHPMTVALWYKPRTVTHAQGDIFFQLRSTGNLNFLIFLMRTETNTLLISNNAPGGVTTRTHHISTPNDIWAHIVGRWHSTEGVQIWHNGIISTDALAGPSTLIGNAMGWLEFGSRSSFLNQQANGELSTVTLWDSALTTNQCENLYRINPLMMRPLPTYYWPLWNLSIASDLINKLTLSAGGSAPPTVIDSLAIAKGPKGLI